ncbi:MFS transporter [Micrococcus sp.]|uniref:MFS transporter n=1 Tax=Micrococcus sp. TaxID=1271 RepID=UPI0026DD0BDA|nr:MFS transporter [Micrococcus sp.]MDO4238891.1 MFS transporter [Micrococcus sp.]
MTPSDPSSARPAPAGEQRAPGTGLLLVLLAAMGVGALFNYGVSASSTVVIERLGVSSGRLGTVLTVVFASAAVTSVALGRAADRLSSRTQMSIIFGGSVLALTVGAFATTLGALYAAAAVAGVTQAISNPTTNRVIRSVVPAERRIGWIGVKQSGVQVSQLVAGLFFPTAALVLGWTGAALAAAGLAAVLWAVAVAAVPPLPASSGAATAADARAGRVPLPATVWFFAAIAFLTGLGMQATNAYLPLFAVESLGLSLVVGGAAAAASGVIGVASRIWWGRRMSAGHRPTTLLAGIALGSMAGVGVFLAADLAHAPALLWAGAAVHGLTVLGANVVTNAGLLDVVPAEHLGRATGVNAMGMYAGFACGPLVMGLLRDLTGDFRLGFAAVGAGYALALVAVLLLRRHTDRAAAGSTA